MLFENLKVQATSSVRKLYPNAQFADAKSMMNPDLWQFVFDYVNNSRVIIYYDRGRFSRPVRVNNTIQQFAPLTKRM